MQNNRFSRMRTRRRNVSFNSYNSGIVEKLKNKRFQRQAAVVTALFLFFQILSPFGSFLAKSEIFAVASASSNLIHSTSFTSGTDGNFSPINNLQLDGDTGDSTYGVKFNQAMKADTITATNIHIKTCNTATISEDNIIDSTVSYDSINFVAIIRPLSSLNHNSKYYVYLNEDVLDSTSNYFPSMSGFRASSCSTTVALGDPLDVPPAGNPSFTIESGSINGSNINTSVSLINVRYSEEMDFINPVPTPSDRPVLFKKNSGGDVAVTNQGVAYDPNNHVHTISLPTPSGLEANSVYYIKFQNTGSPKTLHNKTLSPVVSAEYTALDDIAPVVTAFTASVPTAMTTNISITATDAVGVTGYAVTESAIAPASDANVWQSTPTFTYTGSSAGLKTLRAWAKDAAGNVSAVYLTTKDVTFVASPPVLANSGALSPADGATGVLKSSNLQVKFDKAIAAGASGNNAIKIYKSDDTLFASIPANDSKVTVNSDTVTINPASDFAANTDYYVQIENAAFNSSSANFAGISDKTTWNFTTAADGTVATPTFTPPAGAVSAGQGVVINSEAGATIKYTTDGSTPTCTTGTTYSSSITINTATTIKAIACKSGSTDSAVATAAYTISSGGGGSQDTTAPSITPGTVTRTSASAGTVVFTSNESGKYYFLVAGDGDSAPTVNQIIGGMTGVSYNAGNITVNISGLASGAKDIYFILEDSVPNRTVATKFDMPAYANPDTCPSCEIKGIDDTVNKNGATINFPDNPSNLGDGFNIAVTQNAASSRTAPTNKTIQNIYDITPSKSLTGTYSATITLAYPSGQTYKSGDTVMYWDINSNAWSSSGISGITGSGGNISFSTNHFTEFAIITDALASNNGGTNNGTGSTTGTGGTTVGGILPTAGSTILNMFLNFMLAIGGYVLIQRYLKKSRYGAFVN